jgi:hypothetical protein
MFENIIVTSDLLPIRQAASQGDLNAMCQLARYLVDQDSAKISTEMVEKICTKIATHKELEDNIEHIIDLCKLLADCYSILHKQDKLDTVEARKQMRLKLMEVIFWSTQLPFEQWNIEELKNCVDWLFEESITPIDAAH